MSLHDVSPHAEGIVSKSQALRVNTSAAVGLQRVLQSNLGPTGTLKLLVGATLEQLKLTKDGAVLLKEMQIQHPTACLIARTASAQDAVTGDGTTTVCLLVGELLRLAEQTMSSSQGVGTSLHPRHIVDGYELALKETLSFLDTSFKVVQDKAMIENREVLLNTARTSLSTKLDAELVEKLSAAVVDAIQTIHSPDTPLDLNLVERLTLQRHSAMDSRLIQGLVLDHGGRHPDMPRVLKNCRILTCNVSLEYEQAETQAGFVYSTAEEREKLVESERIWLDERCRKIVDLKRRVCAAAATNEKDSSSSSSSPPSFVIINQKGVDPLSLDMFAKEGILCLRRAKRRNMERLTMACGGQVVLSLEDLNPDVLGYAGLVTQEEYGDDKYTFVEDCPHAKSCTLLLQGPNQLTLEQLKDAVGDGLRAVKNAVEDGAVVPGAGSFEIAASLHLRNTILPNTKGKMQLGVSGFADALEIVPKTLVANSGGDVADVLLQLRQERTSSGLAIGWNCRTNTLVVADEEGILDNVRVKRQGLHLATVLANQLLLVDEVMRAGKRRPQNPGGDDM